MQLNQSLTDPAPVKEAPHSVSNSLVKVDAVLGKSWARTLYASLTQLEQVMLDGIVVVVIALVITS